MSGPILAFGAVLLAGTAVPYLLPRASLAPMTGAALWLAVLYLRAVLVLLAALIVVFYLPATELFRMLTHWCVHAVIPFLATHLGFSGHGVGDAAALLPGFLLAGLYMVYVVGRLVRQVTTKVWRRYTSRASKSKASKCDACPTAKMHWQLPWNSNREKGRYPVTMGAIAFSGRLRTREVNLHSG